LGLVVAKRADGRTRTADLISLRVSGQWLLSVAKVCEFRMSEWVFPDEVTALKQDSNYGFPKEQLRRKPTSEHH
jgi:hypothetical protein